MTVEAVVGVVIGGLIGALLALIASVRGLRVHRARDRARRATPCRARLLSLAGDADHPSADLEFFRTRDRRTWAAIEPTVIDLAGKVKGAPRAALVGLLLERGMLERSLRRSTRRRAGQRVIAASQLATLGTPEASVRLHQLVGDHDAEVRSAAVRAIGRIGDPAGVTVLVSALRPGHEVPRRIVAQALLRIGAGGAPELIDALSAPTVQVSATAADVLGLLGIVEAAPTLVEMAAEGSDPRLRRAAVTALGRIGTPSALPVAMGALDPGSPPDLRAAAARALGQLGHPRAVALLVQAAGDPVDEVADRAVHALIDVGPAGREALRALAHDRSQPGSLAGAAALAYLERAAPSGAIQAHAADAGHLVS